MRNQNNRRGFSLVELLTVIAIISLLIGILIPSLSKARDQAKKLKSSAQMKGIGEGLELFRTENDNDGAFRASNGYPPSRFQADDPNTSDTDDEVYGAHWIVRCLYGLDMRGYAPKRNVGVGTDLMDNPDEWYTFDVSDPTNPKPVVQRVGPYLDVDGVSLAATNELPGADSGSNNPPRPNGAPDESFKLQTQPVFVDTFGMPVLYYAANAALANAPVAAPVGVGYPTEDLGVYSLNDNWGFTGGCVCTGSTCTCTNGWNFGAGSEHPLTDMGEGGYSVSKYFSDTTDTIDYVRSNPDTAAGFFSDKKMLNMGGISTLVPVRKNSYILISAGKDKLYGTNDDIRNY